jgi:hypothetical protein
MFDTFLLPFEIIDFILTLKFLPDVNLADANIGGHVELKSDCSNYCDGFAQSLAPR